MSAAPTTRRTADAPIAPAWLALLAGPLSFGITGPTLVLAEIARDLGVSLVGAASVVTAFGWGIAVGTPLAGGLLARRGLRTALVVAALLVAAGAVLVIAVPVLAVLVVGTALQALGAAGFTVVAMSIAGSAAAMGTVTASLAVLGSIAPLVGSQVAAAWGWPVALVMPVLALLAVPAVLRAGTSGGRQAGRFDLAGAILLVAWVTALVMLTHSPVAAAVAALALTALLAWHVRRRPAGFVPVELVRAPRFLVASGLALALAVVNFGIVYAAPAMVTDLTGWTSGQLGLALLWPYLGGGAVSWFLVSGSARLSFPVWVATLAAGAVAAPAIVAFGNGSVALLFAGMAIGSLAASTGNGALALWAGAAVPQAVRPTAMGLFTLFYLLGAAFGPVLAALAVG
ncbi:MFS transporter [Pseudonocardia hierapolitana]|uniref:MFS transporter n=1 Tax=Pseudonocardia hierapolitana TaxID=1128676 RepID=A0A561SL12_9PSEU|nr:MFS transporter [Pseudonocardia hierapolitana]TWF75565.1 MFS transporter [Pseudonocardia hierapolitana]